MSLLGSAPSKDILAYPLDTYDHHAVEAFSTAMICAHYFAHEVITLDDLEE